MTDRTPPIQPFDEPLPALDDLLTRRVPLSERAPGASNIVHLLSTLDLPEPVASDADRRLLVDVTFARILRARDEHAVARLSPSPATTGLREDDALGLDEMIDSGWTVGASERARRAHALVSLLDAPTPVELSERSRTVDAALARVQSDMDAQSRRLRLDPVERPGFSTPGFRWRELGAIAAMLLIGAGIFWPMVGGIRTETRRAMGQANMQQASIGFGLFGADHDERLPALDPQGNEGLWWQVGTPAKSHSANLYTLVRTSYVPIGALASPGNPYAPTEVADEDARDWRSSQEVSYSYQLFGKIVPRLGLTDGAPRMLLADRSPVVERSRLGLPVDPNANSSNHAGLGQFVLLSNGHVRFLRTPTLDGVDNIWLPGRLERTGQTRVIGTELPTSRSDAFVGP